MAPLRTELPAWRDQGRRIADYGFSTLLMPDVQQWQPAPAPTLAVAATLTDLRRLGLPVTTPGRRLAQVRDAVDDFAPVVAAPSGR